MKLSFILFCSPTLQHKPHCIITPKTRNCWCWTEPEDLNSSAQSNMPKRALVCLDKHKCQMYPSIREGAIRAGITHTPHTAGASGRTSKSSREHTEKSKCTAVTQQLHNLPHATGIPGPTRPGRCSVSRHNSKMKLSLVMWGVYVTVWHCVIDMDW